MTARSSASARAAERMPAGDCLNASWFRLGVALRRRQIAFELLGRPARPVARRVALNSPTFRERTGVDDVEAELVDHLRDGRLGGGIVSGDHERAAIVRAARLPVG